MKVIVSGFGLKIAALGFFVFLLGMGMFFMTPWPTLDDDLEDYTKDLESRATIAYVAGLFMIIGFVLFAIGVIGTLYFLGLETEPAKDRVLEHGEENPEWEEYSSEGE